MCTKTESRACIFFIPSFEHFCTFRIFISAISLGQKTFVVLCIIALSKKHFRMHCIERGMTNPPRWQWLGRPSSYFLSLHFCVFVYVRTTHWCAVLFTCTSRLRLVRPKMTFEIDDKKKSEHPHTAVRSMSLLAKKSLPTPIPMTPKISRSPRIAHPDR